MTPSTDQTLHDIETLLPNLSMLPQSPFYRLLRFPNNICDVCGMPTEVAYSLLRTPSSSQLGFYMFPDFDLITPLSVFSLLICYLYQFVFERSADATLTTNLSIDQKCFQKTRFVCLTPQSPILQSNQWRHINVHVWYKVWSSSPETGSSRCQRYTMYIPDIDTEHKSLRHKFTSES